MSGINQKNPGFSGYKKMTGRFCGRAKERFWEIDFLRGLCVALMILDHFMFCVLAVAPIAIKASSVGNCGKPAILHLLHPDGGKRNLCKARKIDMPLSFGAALDAVGGFAEMPLKGFDNFRPRFKVIKSDARSKPSSQEQFFCLALAAHFLDRLFDDARGKTSPAGVHGCRNASLFIGNQNRQAIGHLHCTDNARRCRYLRIGLQRLVFDLVC